MRNSLSGSTLLTGGNNYWLEAAAPLSGYNWYFMSGVMGTYGFFSGGDYQYYYNQQLAAFRINGSSTAPVPLPAAAWLLLSGLGGLGFLRKRKAA